MSSYYLSVCEEAARSAGKVLVDMLGNISVRHKKNPRDLVTEADVAAQKTIETIVLGAFPDHRFLGEEGNLSPSTSNCTSEFCWLVDPLDGTTNFVHGVPCFGPSIALTKGTEVLCGVFYNPMTEEFFSAEKGQGAFLNGKRMQTSHRQTLVEALPAVTFPTQSERSSPDLAAFLKAMPLCRYVNRFGGQARQLSIWRTWRQGDLTRTGHLRVILGTLRRGLCLFWSRAALLQNRMVRRLSLPILLRSVPSQMKRCTVS